MGNNDFSVVIVDYKSANKTSEYVEYLQTVLKENINIIIVDNSVDDINTNVFVQYFDMKTFEKDDVYGEVKCSKLKRSMLYLLNPQENLGYARGNNLGVYFSSNRLNSKYSVISNNDVKIMEEWMNLDEFREVFARDEKVAVIGPSIIGLDGEKQSPCRKKGIWSRWILMSIIYPYQNIIRRPTSSDLVKNAKEGYVYRVQGSFFAARNDYFMSVGGFDPNTFLYGEEMILSERLKRIKCKVYYLSKIHILHEHSQTISNHFDAMKRMRIRYESEMYYYKTYLGIPSYQLRLAEITFSFYEKKYMRKNS